MIRQHCGLRQRPGCWSLTPKLFLINTPCLQGDEFSCSQHVTILSRTFMNRALAATLPSDQRARMGAWLFIGSLVVFFVSSILLYGIYAWSRRDDPFRNAELPWSFLASSLLLFLISGLLHAATRAVRRDKWKKTSWLLSIGAVAAVIFLAVQVFAMLEMLDGPATAKGNGRGVVGMVIVLAFLHALHVAGGVISLGIVAVRAAIGRYDHERHFAVDFAAQYWHFLDLVWIVMLIAFWSTTGGF
jgi:cytochrome c oxidase subunit III